jgi:HAD superfamily hydrolase (TIGR01459 family)
MPNTKFCQGISDISDSYTGFVIDTWGVIHNGETLFDTVSDCLKELQGRKKFVMLLSNTEQRADEASAELKAMGLPSAMYNSIVTSGEMLWQGINNQTEGIFTGLGDSYYLIGGDRTREFMKTLPVTEVKDVAEAKFLLVSGWDALPADISVFEDTMREAIRKRLKILCVHPDSRAMLVPNHVMGASAQIAKRLQELGGVVNIIGKPFRPIYHHCITVLHRNDIYPGQTVMIGDTMAHDIVGASLVNMDTCLVRNGFHAPLFKTATTPGEVNKMLNMLIAQYNGVRPTYLVDRLKWGKALPDRKHRRRTPA